MVFFVVGFFTVVLVLVCVPVDSGSTVLPVSSTRASVNPLNVPPVCVVPVSVTAPLETEPVVATIGVCVDVVRFVNHVLILVHTPRKNPVACEPVFTVGFFCDVVLPVFTIDLVITPVVTAQVAFAHVVIVVAPETVVLIVLVFDVFTISTTLLIPV